LRPRLLRGRVHGDVAMVIRPLVMILKIAWSKGGVAKSLTKKERGDWSRA
jgi:hypothetical protein